MVNRLVKTLLILLGALVLVLFVVWSKNQKIPSSPSEPALSQTKPTPEPQKEWEIESPDGTAALVVKQKKQAETTTQTYLIKDKEGKVSQVFSKTLGNGTVLSVPFNTFSPDNKYIFLKEIALENTRFFVLPGEVDFSTQFEQKYPMYDIADVTGWAGVTLIIINTKEEDGTTGPSFWYDVSNGSFTRLSSRF